MKSRMIWKIFGDLRKLKLDNVLEREILQRETETLPTFRQWLTKEGERKPFWALMVLMG